MPNVKTHHLGPKLCYSIGRDGISIRGSGVVNNDIIIFCFGEIDCRCHIHKHIGKKSYKEIIDDIVEKYFIALKKCIESLTVTTCVYNVVPTVRAKDIKENPEFPLVGSDEERKRYVLYFNSRLKDKCHEYGFIFFDVYDKYIDKDGFLNRGLSDGNVHIQDGRFIENFLKT
uniref:SGNH hydrolase-type esterase domain-containing protein n=1 Tax=viral metagenome TaxID=1070528 RepID=A0A6C0BCB1_9ZZZZ